MVRKNMKYERTAEEALAPSVGVFEAAFRRQDAFFISSRL